MLTDTKILGKLEQIERRYKDLRFEKVMEVPMEMWETKNHYRYCPSSEQGAEWTPAPAGTRWGDNWVTAWFKGAVSIPTELKGKKVYIHARTGGETLFLVDGIHKGVFDENHPVVCMTAAAEERLYELAFEAYSGHYCAGTQPSEEGRGPAPKSKRFNGIDLVVEREDVSAFVFDLLVLRQLAIKLDGNSLRKGRIIRELAKVYALVDIIPAETGEAHWRPKLAEAREIMQPLLESRNSPTTPWFGAVGHSHIDTAWLWPVAETWRKCARTFSSVLNLMDQYPEFLFIQTSPCQTEVIRKEYPDIFEKITARVKEGRWEPNGAMWVEPDCNIPSGESFVRQLLVGQRWTRQWFSYTSNTLWLPDVFGYSAALPQILKKAGVDYFCTTKIAWNDTTRFPYDTFYWKGIDGSSVISHYNTIHCIPDPASLIDQWNWVQHKDIQDRRIISYGYGDGGGGPMAEMIEIGRRVEDLEGCPKIRNMHVGEFMKGVDTDLGPSLPTWSGELYLELHRGTLTSVAKVKKGNRKVEYALRDAEFLSTMAKLNGGDYPADELLEIWKTVLMNQFHDILPGSSIPEVNDEAIESLAKCIEDTKALSGKALSFLSDSVSGSGAGYDGGKLLLANTLSWDRAGEFVIDALPGGQVPSARGLTTQAVSDIEGNSKLALWGLSLPSMGAITLPVSSASQAGETGSSDSDVFRYTGNTLETPYATVSFDGIGRISGLYDKQASRQLVNKGSALNSILIGEDVPQAWDNWDIDRDQSIKMRVEDRLISREVVAQGPLQFRIRSTYKLGLNSIFAQDMVFHSTTPRIDFETKVDWKEKHTLLKAAFDIDILADSARHEIQYGHVERPTHANLPQDRARFEVCAHKWTDISDNGCGVALINDCKYGIGVLGSKLRLSLLKSGTHPDPRGDEGVHSFTYSLLPHNAGFSVGSVVKPAYEQNIPVVVAAAGPENDGFDSLLSVDSDNVIIETVKWAEDGGGFIVRLYDAGRAGSRVNLNIGVPFKAVYAADLLEQKAEALCVAEGQVEISVKPFEIVTLFIEV